MSRKNNWIVTQTVGKYGLIVALAFLVPGCADKRPVERPGQTAVPPRPAPVQPAPPPPPVARPIEIPEPALPPTRLSVPAPQEGKAAGALLASARQSRQAGQWNQAEMSLERALRLEPRNARLWHEMAQVKFESKEYRQAVQFCIKSNSLAGKDYDLMEQNWQLMEKAYLQLGEPEKARQVRIKAG